jgi:type IV pilus assembly protein PilA
MNLIVYKNRLSSPQEGFTLIELLIVMVIISILGAVALPAFLNQSSKAQQAEAKQVMKTVNQSQSLYRAQNSRFSNNFDLLAVGIIKSTAGTPNVADTNYFSYKIVSADEEKATVTGDPKDSATKAYSGGIWRYTNSDDEITMAIDFCESDANGISATEVSFISSYIQCPAQFQSISR